jgi:hypothetical protein
LRASQGVIAHAFGVERAFDQSVAALHHPAAAERSQLDFLFFSRLETYGCACGYIQAHAVGRCAIELELAVGLEKMEMAAYLDRTVAGIAHDHALCFATGVRFDGPGGFVQKIFTRFNWRSPCRNG